MGRSKRSPAPNRQAAGPGGRLRHRSGAVARMLCMPVATLRVWERRYGVSKPELSPSGQRLYSEGDVRRLALLKELTDHGHAIGSLAPLSMAQLQQVAHLHAKVASREGKRAYAALSPPARPFRLAVIGAALGARLQRPELLRRLDHRVALLGPFDDIAQAAVKLRSADVDVLVIQEARLHGDWMAAIDAAAPAFAAVRKAVLFGFAADTVCEALASAGTALLREPQPDAVLAQWLSSLAIVVTAPSGAPPGMDALSQPMPARRWDDAALADFAGRSSTIACECPRHVAELLVQLSHFESYSADCALRSVADAQLHGYLGQVAAAARARFESALEQVALHEGLMLPDSTLPQP